MGFLDIGAGEIILILVLALIIMGPGKIPEIARTLGKTIRAIKKASSDFTTAVSREMDVSQDEPAAPPDKAVVTPPAIDNKAASSDRDDRSDKPGEASATK